MDEIDKRLRADLFGGPAERPLPGGVDALEVAIEGGGAQQLVRELPETGALGGDQSEAIRKSSHEPTDHKEGCAASQVVEGRPDMVRPRNLPEGVEAQRQRGGCKPPPHPELDRHQRDRKRVKQRHELVGAVNDDPEGEDRAEQEGRSRKGGSAAQSMGLELGWSPGHDRGESRR